MDAEIRPEAVLALAAETREAMQNRRTLEDIAFRGFDESEHDAPQERMFAAMEFMMLCEQANNRCVRQVHRAKANFFMLITGCASPQELVERIERGEVSADELDLTLDLGPGDPDAAPSGLADIPGIDLSRTAEEPNAEAEADGEDNDHTPEGDN